MKAYTPRNDSFPYRTLMYLSENGESKNEDIRRGIGLNEHCKNSSYSDRSSYYFDWNIVAFFMIRGLINRTKTGYYELTINGRALTTKLVDKELTEQLITIYTEGWMKHEMSDFIDRNSEALKFSGNELLRNVYELDQAGYFDFEMDRLLREVEETTRA